MKQMPLNVLGTEIKECSRDPLTGFYRTGCCETGPEDHGHHLVCIEATAEFLIFSKSRGNDLSTPMPEFGAAPPVHLEATHILTLEFIDLADLKQHAVKSAG